MKCHSRKVRPRSRPELNEFAGFPSADELAALRAWYEGLSSREAVARYLGDERSAGDPSHEAYFDMPVPGCVHLAHNHLTFGALSDAMEPGGNEAGLAWVMHAMTTSRGMPCALVT